MPGSAVFDDEQDKKRKVADLWGTVRFEGRLPNWLQHPVAIEIVNSRISGDPQVGASQWFKERYFPAPAQRCLSLGCGHGHFERDAISRGIAKEIDAFDISEGAIENARKSAEDAGLVELIHYSVRDLDQIELPPSAYDAIFIMSAAHHVSNLENLFAQCAQALRPGGLLILNEYIGPNRFQSSPFVAQTIAGIRAILPERYRRDLFKNDGSVFRDFALATAEQVAAVDPSEAIRSADILHELERWFTIRDFRPYGGGIQHLLFSGIMGNFDANDDADVALVRSIATTELLLEEVGAIGSDFAVVVARPKPNTIDPAMSDSETQSTLTSAVPRQYAIRSRRSWKSAAIARGIVFRVRRLLGA
jgi:2-polyprenyl-3-methyl-5-hydroxy-6-metoxy-1,4-benzoquinol methylase